MSESGVKESESECVWFERYIGFSFEGRGQGNVHSRVSLTCVGGHE